MRIATGKNWPGAIDALKRSREIAPGGADPFDCFFFVAMAWWQLGDQEKARSWYNAAVKRLEEEINPNINEWCPDFIRFREEAEELMGARGTDRAARSEAEDAVSRLALW